MSNVYFPSTKVNLPKGQSIRWMEEVLETGEGNFKVSNKGGDYIELHNGIFSMKFRGVTKQIRKSRETTREIFIKRLERYQGFEYNGYFYYFQRGDWYKKKKHLKNSI